MDVRSDIVHIWTQWVVVRWHALWMQFVTNVHRIIYAHKMPKHVNIIVVHWNKVSVDNKIVIDNLSRWLGICALGQSPYIHHLTDKAIKCNPIQYISDCPVDFTCSASIAGAIWGFCCSIEIRGWNIICTNDLLYELQLNVQIMHDRISTVYRIDRKSVPSVWHCATQLDIDVWVEMQTHWLDSVVRLMLKQISSMSSIKLEPIFIVEQLQ